MWKVKVWDKDNFLKCNVETSKKDEAEAIYNTKSQEVIRGKYGVGAKAQLLDDCFVKKEAKK